LGSNLGISALFGWLGVESTTHSLIRAAQDNPGILLALVPLSYLVVGPGEELLYRNVVQKSLSTEFSPPGAVVVASAIFAAVHLPAYADPSGSALAVLNTLAVVFVLSLILGALYERTENVAVSALVHGSFNAIAFLVTYVEITGFPG
jgi:membrane protease YdiL (CAAX protease family)